MIALVSACIICFNLQAQQRMTIDLEPSFDAPASIEIQVKQHRSVQIVFKQMGTLKPDESAFSWVQDTITIVHPRRLGRYFQQFAFSDTIRLEAQSSTNLLKAFTEVYVNRDELSRLKDDRLMIDGMPCLIIIPVSKQNQYTIAFRPPALTKTQTLDRLIREILAALKIESTNPATVNYCMIIGGYLK
ncbi:hypothetical protein [Spirosoma sp. KUDC1026]|uniref:hypothetical protein n=1 Tax=Spirosoma sp. KUDC1026 TaxID=2745947 RepID=UPI00159BB1D9|nr:hypothetical protein [Spirosoma sp. KUDC1026]QKZ14491.1 hypothetical protein HU175_18410 [Spirosoma sp. KUDC1026]